LDGESQERIAPCSNRPKPAWSPGSVINIRWEQQLADEREPRLRGRGTRVDARGDAGPPPSGVPSAPVRPTGAHRDGRRRSWPIHRCCPRGGRPRRLGRDGRGRRRDDRGHGRAHDTTDTSRPRPRRCRVVDVVRLRHRRHRGGARGRGDRENAVRRLRAAKIERPSVPNERSAVSWPHAS
jgi:hypothetical protein